MTAAVPSNVPNRNFVRWLWTWIALGIIVVVVVIGFLIGINRALTSINSGLAEASDSVAGAGGDVEPLPAHIEKVNVTLGDIDKSLLPIRGQADDIGLALGTITESLRKIDVSLKDTSGSLVDTSTSLNDTSGVLISASDSVASITGSLADTSDVLKNTLSTADDIDSTLKSAQSADSKGTRAVVGRIDVINGLLRDIQSDTSNINQQLVRTNEHLDSVCNSPLLTLVGTLLHVPPHTTC